MKKEIGMIAGGTGVTPMIQVLKKILGNPEDKTKVTLLFANREERDILLKTELDELEKQHANLRVHYTLDKPSKSWNGLRGYVSEDMIKKHLPSPSEDNLILICGPDGFLSHVCGPKLPDRSQGEIAGLLKKMGYTSNQIYKF